MADPVSLAIAALVIFVAAFVQGVTGFAHGLIAIGLLSLIFGPAETVLILALLAVPISVAIFVRVRDEVPWREVAGISVPLCLIGMPLGIFAFSLLLTERDLLTRIVGAVLVLSAGYFLTPFAPRPRELHFSWGALAGFLAGFLGGLTSTGGPPLVLYLYAREMPKRRRMALLQGVFLVGSAAKVLLLLPTGLLTGPIALHALILLVPLLLGVLLGQRVFDRIPAEPLRKIALILLLAIGIFLLVFRG